MWSMTPCRDILNTWKSSNRRHMSYGGLRKWISFNVSQGPWPKKYPSIWKRARCLGSFLCVCSFCMLAFFSQILCCFGNMCVFDHCLFAWDVFSVTTRSRSDVRQSVSEWVGHGQIETLLMWLWWVMRDFTDVCHALAIYHWLLMGHIMSTGIGFFLFKWTFDCSLFWVWRKHSLTVRIFSHKSITKW